MRNVRYLIGKVVSIIALNTIQGSSLKHINILSLVEAYSSLDNEGYTKYLNHHDIDMKLIVKSLKGSNKASMDANYAALHLRRTV